MSGASNIGIARLARTLLAACALLAVSCDAQRLGNPKVEERERPAASSGLDQTQLGRVLAEAERLPRLRSLLVLRDGEELVGRRFNDGPDLDTPVNIKSASKSVIAALVGIAVDRGVLTGVDQPLASILRADLPTNPDPRLQRITIGHLLSMQAGLQPTSGANYGSWVSSGNWVRDALRRPFEAEPGGRMLYSTGSTHLLSAALTRASGRSTHDLAQEWLAEPLGIAIPPWPRDGQGIYFGGNEMRMSPRALARFGELYRQGGTINGRRLLSAEWIRQSWIPRTTSPWSGGRYGYGWFIGEAGGHPVRYGWGYGGQMVYVVPNLRLTVVMTSDPGGARDRDHIDALNALLADGIIPAAERGGSVDVAPAW